MAISVTLDKSETRIVVMSETKPLILAWISPIKGNFKGANFMFTKGVDLSTMLQSIAEMRSFLREFSNMKAARQIV